MISVRSWLFCMQHYAQTCQNTCNHYMLKSTNSNRLASTQLLSQKSTGFVNVPENTQLCFVIQSLKFPDYYNVSLLKRLSRWIWWHLSSWQIMPSLRHLLRSKQDIPLYSVVFLKSRSNLNHGWSLYVSIRSGNCWLLSSRSCKVDQTKSKEVWLYWVVYE